MIAMPDSSAGCSGAEQSSEGHVARDDPSHHEVTRLTPHDEASSVQPSERLADDTKMEPRVVGDVGVADGDDVRTPLLGRHLEGIEVRLCGCPQLEGGLVDHVVDDAVVRHLRDATCHPRRTAPVAHG